MTRSAVLLSAITMAVVGTAEAEETVGTLTLDGLSYVSFQDEKVLPLTSGSIRFHFGEPLSNGSVPFTIAPEDVLIPEISLDRGGTLAYAIGSPASGLMQETQSGRMITFTAQVVATFREGDHEGTRTYSVPFTTETAAATSQDGTASVEATGMRVVDGYWYARIVGATVNDSNAMPMPKAAVYTVLSGQFDRLPE